jgi:hypothetical protein
MDVDMGSTVNEGLYYVDVYDGTGKNKGTVKVLVGMK